MRKIRVRSRSPDNLLDSERKLDKVEIAANENGKMTTQSSADSKMDDMKVEELDSKTVEDLQDSKMTLDSFQDSSRSEELLKPADAKTSRAEVLSPTPEDELPALPELAPLPEDLEKGDATVGDLDKTRKASNVVGDKNPENDGKEDPKSSPSEFSSEFMSEDEESLNSQGNQNDDKNNDNSTRSRDTIAKSVVSESSVRSGSGRSRHTITPGSRFSNGRITRANMLGLLSSDDEGSDVQVHTSYKRGRRRSLEAYKVPHTNHKPKAGGGFVVIKRQYQPKRQSGVMEKPRRYSLTNPQQGVHFSVSDSSGGSSIDGSAPPPPSFDVSTSMALAISQLKDENERKAAERRAAQKEPKGWLYMTALFTLMLSTGGLMFILLYVFGAAYGNVYQDARRSLEYLSRPGSLDDSSTPQWAALQWLVKKDRADGLDLVKDVARKEARYSLAVLFYSTEGESRWTDKFNFLSGEHECDWNGEVDIDDDAGGRQKVRAGVICDDNRNIIELAMINNQIRGQLPSELSALSGLKSLSFSYNDLSGTIPDWKWKGLESLDMTWNDLEGSIPTSLWIESSALKNLDLSHNKLSSSLPREMSQLSSIESINLGYNDLTGTIALSPDQLVEYEEGDHNKTVRSLVIPTLKTFNVTHNKMRGTLDFVELFPSLQVLDVTNNMMTGRLPGVLGGLTALEALYLSDNQFFGAIPTAIGSLTSLHTIVASNNVLNRQFPWDSFNANNTLTELVFWGNSLTGTLPTAMGKFSNLQVLDFGHNLLSGQIDPSITRDIYLRVLRLSRNQFEGPLPNDPDALPDTLEIIDLHSNQFAGELPASWSNLSSLNVLTLHDNNFLGEIPPDWIQMSSLERLTLHLNQLAGSVDFLCDKQPQPAITANCAGAEPLVECSCCILCLV